MPVGAFDVHVVDAVGCVVVLDAGAGAQPAAPHPAVARSRLRLGFTQGALVDLLVEPIDVALAAALFARADRGLVGGELREARPEPRIDVFVEHLGTGVDVRIDVVDAKTVFHAWSPPSQCVGPLSHGGGGFAYRNCGIEARRAMHRPLCIAGAFAYPPAEAGVAQWQSRSFPSLRRGFDSLHPLQLFQMLRGPRCTGGPAQVKSEASQGPPSASARKGASQP